MTIKELGNNRVRLTPDEGKKLYCTLDDRCYSVAEVLKREVKFYTEVDKSWTKNSLKK